MTLARLRKRDPKLHEAELFAVAILVVRGLSNKDIAQQLRLTEFQVRRLRTEANKRKLFTVDFSKAEIPEVVEKARVLTSRARILDRLQKLTPGGAALKWLEPVVIDDQDTATSDEHLAAFAAKAAPYLLQELRNAEITLITYGTTLLWTVEKAHFPSLGPQFEVYPACCDPFQYSHEPWSSSALALWITERRGIPTQHHPSLAGLLPVIDPNEVLEARRALAKFVVNAPDYRKIYGPGGLAEQANCLITSIGRSMVPWTLGDDYFVKNIGIDRAELTQLIEAEIGSVPLPRANLSAEGKKRFETINNARLGLSLENIKSIAAKAHCGPAPGVIVLAMGANKADCLLALIRRGLVNRAIVDNKLEAELARLLSTL